MSGFGIIIIDDENASLYTSIRQEPFECFKAGNYLKIGLLSAASVVALTLY